MIWVLVGLGAIIATVLIIAALRPKTFEVRRSAHVAAPPAKVYAQIEDFKRWQAWSPWEGLDPELRRTYAGAPKGEGATYAWDGNNKAGAGTMRITGTQPEAQVTIALAFTRPFAATNTTTFDLVPAGDGTQVTWTMRGDSAFMFRVFGLFVNMDKLLGKDFDKGLAKLGEVTTKAGTA